LSDRGQYHKIRRLRSEIAATWSWSLGVVALSAPEQQAEETIARDSRLLQANPDMPMALDYVEEEANEHGLYYKAW
jgi:hypothetical protein